MFVYFLRKYLFTFDKIDAINFRKFLNFNFIKYFYSNGLKALKSICRPPVRLIDKRRLICDHIKKFSYLNKLIRLAKANVI
jgi:hypothetical protein